MNNKIKILLAEDESSLGMIIKESLEQREFIVTLCTNGQEAFEVFLKEAFDALVFDIMMPIKDGLTLANDIRKINPDIPILFLTAKTQTEDVVKGFKTGGNDYIRKPFSIEELIVRIVSLTERKHKKEHQTKHMIGAYEFNTEKQTLIHKKETYKLTHRESSLLELLIKNKGETLSREYILNLIWENDDFFSGRSMDVFITKLRKKLSLDSSIEIINSRGKGYKLVAN